MLEEIAVQHERIGKDPDADSNAKMYGLDDTLVIEIRNGKGIFKFRGPNFDPIP